MAQKGAIFVYSMLHVEECRASDRPDVFVEIMEELSAYLLEPANAADRELVLSARRARDLVLAERDCTDEAMRRMEDLLKPFHFAAGWLGEVEAQDLREEMVTEMDAFWTSLEKEVEVPAYEVLRAAKDEMSQLIQNLPIQRLRDDSQEWLSKLRASLPTNYAQLDEIPAEDIVSYIFSCFDEAEKRQFQRQFPPGFWSEIEGREEGALTGFAFTLFLIGLVRDRRVRKKNRTDREKHFLGQFRDCNHIELAARCAMFVTFDAGAARLAKAIYCYAGVATKVVHLTIRDP